MDFLSRFFDTSGFPPRWQCGSGWANTPALGWLHICSDLAIWSAYFAIPCILIYFIVRRKTVPFRGIFLLFGAFILLCGTTHFMDALIFWWPVYPVAGVIKFLTAIASWATVIALFKVAPLALAMRTPADLEREIAARIAAEQALLHNNEELEARVLERTAEIERANRAKDEFLATVSHELRTPLTPILGWTYLLRDDSLDKATKLRALDVIERNVTIQTHLISDLLDVSRIISGKLRLERKRVDLASVIDSAIETLRPMANAKNVKIERAVGASGFHVNGDQSRLIQIVWNLLSNAIKFTPSGGTVKLALKGGGSQVQIIVSDTGEGITPEFLPHVFERFQQAEMNSSRRHGGMGLGLAIVHRLVEMHGGTVSVESAGKGLGATFTVNLPAATMVDPPRVTRITPTHEINAKLNDSLQDLQVLVVDDEEDTRELVAFVLRRYGAQVVLAPSSDEALCHLKHQAFDVLISDIGMPHKDGYELVKTIRALPPNQNAGIPAIALTAYTREEDRARMIASGFQKHVAKPTQPDELVEAIVALVEAYKKQSPA